MSIRFCWGLARDGSDTYSLCCIVHATLQNPHHSPLLTSNPNFPSFPSLASAKLMISNFKPELSSFYDLTSAMIAFNNFSYDEHEKEVGEMACAMGFKQVSLSSSVTNMAKMVPRGYTGKINSYSSHPPFPSINK